VTSGAPQWALVDLDGTLYPIGVGVMRRVSARIDDYMSVRLGQDATTIRELRQGYYRQYGTSMRGLLLDYDIDPDEYLDYVHQVSASELLAPNHSLGCALARLPWRKVIFTNASAEHARNVMNALGVSQHFERIYDIRSTGYVGKPEPEAFHRVLRSLGVEAEHCITIDDSLPNLQTASGLGIRTVWVGAETPVDGVDFAIDRLERIDQVACQIMGDIRCGGAQA
jgi:putative hydrolase of the HAD superfamily